MIQTEQMLIVREQDSILRIISADRKAEYFFQHYKDLQPNAWSKILGWADRETADKLIMESIDRYWAHKREMQ